MTKYLEKMNLLSILHEEDNEVRVPESNGQDTSGMVQVPQNITFNIRMSWKPFEKKKKIHKG